MMTKDEHIEYLNKRLQWCFILLVIVALIGMVSSVECFDLMGKLRKEKEKVHLADSINTINAQYFATIQAQFDSTTKHIRPYENPKNK